MFRITEDPSSGSLVQCLTKNYKNDCIVSLDMDKVGIIAAYSDSCAWVLFTVHEGTAPGPYRAVNTFHLGYKN